MGTLSRMEFYLILALGPRNGLDYCVVNRHKAKGEIIMIIITMMMMMIMIIIINLHSALSARF